MKQTASLYDFTVTWEPYQLRPGIPEEGIEKPPQYKTVNPEGHLYKAGQSVGIDFTAKCTNFPNTTTGHVMLEYAKGLDESRKIQNNVAEQIFQAYFTDGIYPNRVLMDNIAKKMNFDMNAYNSHMDSSSSFKAIEEKISYWRRRVQSGVPYFIFNGQPGFSGAQDTPAFIKAFEMFSASAGNL